MTTDSWPRMVKSRIASIEWTLLCSRMGSGIYRQERMDGQVNGSFSKETSWALVLLGPLGGLVCVDGREHDIQGEGVYSQP